MLRAVQAAVIMMGSGVSCTPGETGVVLYWGVKNRWMLVNARNVAKL